MKHGRRPTREQCKLIEKARKRPEDWLVERETPEEMVLVHRYNDRTKAVIRKG